MLIKNITDRSTPKPISVGTYILMPGESENVSDNVAYIDEFDKFGNKTGKKKILPAIILLAGMGHITYEETKKQVEVIETEEDEVVEEKPRRGRKPKAE